jgi:hypothetical protein
MAAGFAHVDSGFCADKSEWQSAEGKRFDSLRAHHSEQFTNRARWFGEALESSIIVSASPASQSAATGAPRSGSPPLLPVTADR